MPNATKLFQFLCTHRESGASRQDLLLGDYSDDQALETMQRFWPSYTDFWLERSAVIDADMYWHFSQKVRLYKGEPQVQVRLLHNPISQQWGMVLLNKQAEVLMSVPKFGINPIEFHLDGQQPWAASNRYSYHPVPEIPFRSPTLWSYYHD